MNNLIEWEKYVGVLLKDACPNLFSILVDYFSANQRDELLNQVARILIVKQLLGGEAMKFSFMAFPIPRLSFEQVKDMELIDEESININASGINIRVVVDDFGQINWFYIEYYPELYDVLRDLLSR